MSWPVFASLRGYDRSWLRGDLGAGLSSGMVVNGSLSKTAVNGSAGARSQASGLVVGERRPHRWG